MLSNENAISEAENEGSGSTSTELGGPNQNMDIEINAIPIDCSIHDNRGVEGEGYGRVHQHDV